MGWVSVTVDIIKLVIVFLVIVVAIKFKRPLWMAIGISIVAAALLYQIPIMTFGTLLLDGVASWNTVSVLLILYTITFLQRLLERKSQLKLAQRDLNGIFNNRRINASLAPIFIGLLPSAAAAIICGDIVSDACKDDLSTDEKAFVTSYFRHIPESFLPTYSSVIIMSRLCGVPIASFIIGMIPLEIVLYLLGYFFYLRKVPKETGDPPSENKFKDFLNLIKHLWSLIVIIVLILAFNVDTLIAIAVVTVASFFIYKFKFSEIPGLLKSAFEPKLIVSTILIMIFKEVITHTGVIELLPDAFSKLPIPTFLVFALIFFFGTVVSGSTAIIAICTTLAFQAIPGSGMPLMVLLMSFSYAAMQISPTHVCLAVITEYFHTDISGIVKKTIPVITSFCIITVIYYLLLTAFI